MPLDEKQFAAILDEIIAETLDLKKQDQVRFSNALVERLREEDCFPEEDDDIEDEAADKEEE
jgi:hypothetical protein